MQITRWRKNHQAACIISPLGTSRAFLLSITVTEDTEDSTDQFEDDVDEYDERTN